MLSLIGLILCNFLGSLQVSYIFPEHKLIFRHQRKKLILEYSYQGLIAIYSCLNRRVYQGLAVKFFYIPSNNSVAIYTCHTCNFILYSPLIPSCIPPHTSPLMSSFDMTHIKFAITPKVKYQDQVMLI